MVFCKCGQSRNFILGRCGIRPACCKIQCFVCVSVHRCGFWRVFGRSDLQRFADQGSVRLIQAGYGGCHVIQLFDQNFGSNTDGIDLRRADERCLESWSRTIRRKNHAGDDEQIERCEIVQKLAAGIAAADARNHAFGDSDYYDGCFDAVGSCVLSEHKMQKS